jgi:hypothetical protein
MVVGALLYGIETHARRAAKQWQAAQEPRRRKKKSFPRLGSSLLAKGSALS